MAGRGNTRKNAGKTAGVSQGEGALPSRATERTSRQRSGAAQEIRPQQGAGQRKVPALPDVADSGSPFGNVPVSQKPRRKVPPTGTNEGP